MSANAIEREALRQRQLLRALWQRGDDSALTCPSKFSFW
jgi:hypothetical protein